MFFASAFVAEILGTVAGFGSSTVFLPLALLFLDFKTALVLVAFFHIFGSASRVGFFRHGLDTQLLVHFGGPSIVATVVGALLVSHTSQTTLKGVLGLFLIGYSLFAFFEERFRIKENEKNMVIGGALSGFLAGLIGTGGALRGAFLTAFGTKKLQYYASAAAIGLVVDLTRIPLYLTQGFLPSSFYWYVPVLLLVAIIGSFVGKRIVDRISQRQFKNVVLVALMLIGVKFIVEWL